jgi:putative endopeptidase
MKIKPLAGSRFVASLCAWALTLAAAEAIPPVPRFSTNYMDRAVPPGRDFYRFAAGTWLKQNPVPPDKSRWSGFEELQQRNWFLIREILETCAAERATSARREVRQIGDFFASAMDTNRLEQLGVHPLDADLARIAALASTDDLFRLLADFHRQGLGGLFGMGVSPDAKNSGFYGLYFSQGGLGLPSRDYYFEASFAQVRDQYRAHIGRMLRFLGASEAEAARQADTILELETALAKASKKPAALRDALANYHKLTLGQAAELAPAVPWARYLDGCGLTNVDQLIVRQPEFFSALGELLKERPLADWKVYLRWNALRGAAPFLNAAVEQEWFAFYETTLRGTPEPEPRWQRAAHVIDGSIGEALGQLFVEKHFPPAARARMNELVGNLKAVFRDRLAKLDWMTGPTRQRALAKFDRFTQKIGHPDKFRDYSSVVVNADDYLGNVRRADAFEAQRRLARLGRPVDRTEWGMTPQTVNAYFNPTQNEIVFPAGILQPPFFDLAMDDAVNYGAIGVVIGHEMTHGYDDQGRKFDADGNLNDWWTEADAREFSARARKLVEQYNAYEALPGQYVNGELTLGENIADLGGDSIAYEALQRALAKDPAQRKQVDGFTPEQRFFLSHAQLWRTNWRAAELKRRLSVDPHAPGQFRAIGPLVNLAPFFDAFNITAADPMWRPLEQRAQIW